MIGDSLTISEGIITAPFIQEMSSIILTFVTTLVLSYFTMYRWAKNKVVKEVKQDIDKKSPFRIVSSLSSIMQVRDMINNLIITTPVDRFLILVAINGKTEFRTATAIYEQWDDEFRKHDDPHLTVSATNEYYKYEIDNSYREMLRVAETSADGVHYRVDEMPDCVLKDIYDFEKVKYSSVVFLRRVSNYDMDGNDMVIYCSIATHQDTPLIPEYISKIRSVTYKLKEEVNNLEVIINKVP